MVSEKETRKRRIERKTIEEIKRWKYKINKYFNKQENKLKKIMKSALAMCTKSALEMEFKAQTAMFVDYRLETTHEEWATNCSIPPYKFIAMPIL